MPLTTAQMEFIECSIDHLLEFPANKEELTTGINQLKNWITNPSDHPDDNNIYAILARCLRSPETSFQHLEDYGADATVQEVQQHLLSLITTTLERTVTTENLSLSDIGWDIITLAALCRSVLTDSLFKSVDVDYQTAFPWEDIHDDNSIYNASLTFNESYTHVIINVIVTLPGKSENILITKKLCKLPKHEIETDTFLSNLIPKAKKFGRACAAVEVMHELTRLSSESTERVNCSLFINHYFLLANHLLAASILNQKISLSHLNGLSNNQRASLLHPVAAQLVERNFCTLDKAASIPVTTLSVMQSYISIIDQGIVTIADFAQLSRDQKKLLKHPLVINLIHKIKLPFASAATLPPVITKLFSSNLYADFFLNTEVKWSTFTRLEKSHIDILLNPSIANCIKHGILTFDHIVYSKKRCKKLRMEMIAALLFNRTISLRDVDKLTLSKCELLNSHLLLPEWLCAKIITINELNLRSPSPLYVAALTKRLEAILDHHPFILHNSEPDSLTSLFNDISLAEWQTTSEPGTLQKKITEKLIRYIQHKVELANTTAANTLHRNLLNFMLTLELNHEHPETYLASIIEAANLYNKQPSRRMTLFGKNYPDRNEFTALCRQLNSLKCFTEPPVASAAPIVQHVKP